MVESEEYPEARQDVHNYHVHDHEEEELLEARANVQDLLRIPKELAFVFEDFDDANQSRELERFLDPSKSCDPTQLIDLALALLQHYLLLSEAADDLKRENGQQI